MIKKRRGHLNTREKDVEGVCKVFSESREKSNQKVLQDFRLSKSTVHRVLHKQLKLSAWQSSDCAGITHEWLCEMFQNCSSNATPPGS